MQVFGRSVDDLKFTWHLAGMRELIGKTRFGDDVYLYWRFVNHEKIYFDISRFRDSKRNYDVCALAGGLIQYFISRSGAGKVFETPGLTALFDKSLDRILPADFETIAESLAHHSSLDRAAYGQSLLHPAFRSK